MSTSSVPADKELAEQLDKRFARVAHALTSSLSARERAQVLGAPDDLGALVQLLLTRNLPAVTGEAFVNAKLRGVEARRRLLEQEGGCVPAATLAQLLGTTRQLVEKRRASGALLAVQPFGRRVWLYPVWQLDESKPLHGLERVLRELPRDDPWGVLSFLLRTDVGGGRTPLQALRAGDIDVVCRSARAHGEQGAV